MHEEECFFPTNVSAAAPALCCLLRVWINERLIKQSQAWKKGMVRPYLLSATIHCFLCFLSLFCMPTQDEQGKQESQETSVPRGKRYVLSRESFLCSKPYSQGNSGFLRDACLHWLSGLMYRKKTQERAEPQPLVDSMGVGLVLFRSTYGVSAICQVPCQIPGQLGGLLLREF